MNIYVANIPFTVSDEDLMGLFQNYGEVVSAKVVTDKFTQRSRGFGFVEMQDGESGQKAIDGTNGLEFKGRALVVNEARPKTDAPRSGGGNRGGGGGFNRRSYNNEY